MMRTITLVILAATLSGCAHTDLTAPCANVAALTAVDSPCDQRQPVNAAIVPSVFAQ
jgi:hypothetical protein